MINLSETFEKYNDEFGKFENVSNKLHSRPDLCAFILLDKLVPDTGDVVASARYDEIFLSIDCEKLAQSAKEGDILTLVQCGVMYSDEYDCLSMFV